MCIPCGHDEAGRSGAHICMVCRTTCLSAGSSCPTAARRGSAIQQELVEEALARLGATELGDLEDSLRWRWSTRKGPPLVSAFQQEPQPTTDRLTLAEP